GEVTNAGQVLVDASLVNETVTGRAFAAALAGLVGAEAQVAVVNDASSQSAYLGTNAHIARSQSVSITAGATRNLDVQSIGGSVAGLAAGGASIAFAKGNGPPTPASSPGAGVSANEGTIFDDRSVHLAANSQTNANVQAIAVAGSIGLAALGSIAIGEVSPTVATTISDGAVIQCGADLTATTHVDNTVLAN